MLIGDASQATVYSLGEDNRCKELTHDAWIPVLAPDGERIAYLTSFASGGANLFIYNLGNGRTARLTNFPRKKMPAGQMWWTRKGERTGFVDDDGRKFWLPDRDERLVFEVQDDDGFGGAPVETWTVRPDGSGLKKIADSQLSFFVGWSDKTGYRHTETDQQRAIVAAAMSHSEDSPQSIATGSNVTWETDTEDGDGQRMRDAIQVVYDYWFRSGRPSLPFVAPLPTSVQNEMRARLSAKNSKYSKNDQDAFIAQITSIFNGIVPSTENETLRYLGIRAQCKEFADRIVQASGGKTHTYSEGKALAVNPKDIRPGMYAFKKDKSHAAIIVAVKWDANGQATHLRLAEANMGTDWTNPGGQVPWKRVVTTTRPVPVSEFFVVPTDSSHVALNVSEGLSSGPVIGTIKGEAPLGYGCGCYFTSTQENKQPVFVSIDNDTDGIEEKAMMHIDGQDIPLRHVKGSSPEPGKKSRQIYSGGGTHVQLDYLSGKSCEGNECEVIEYQLSITVKTKTGETTLPASGDCGC